MINKIIKTQASSPVGMGSFMGVTVFNWGPVYPPNSFPQRNNMNSLSRDESICTYSCYIFCLNVYETSYITRSYMQKKKKSSVFSSLISQSKKSVSWMEKRISDISCRGFVFFFFFFLSFFCYIVRTGAEMWNPSEEFSRVEQTSAVITLKWSQLHDDPLHSSGCRQTHR